MVPLPWGIMFRGAAEMSTEGGRDQRFCREMKSCAPYRVETAESMQKSSARTIDIGWVAWGNEQRLTGEGESGDDIYADSVGFPVLRFRHSFPSGGPFFSRPAGSAADLTRPLSEFRR
jgi:hypothetical protein